MRQLTAFWQRYLYTPVASARTDLALLILRLGTGAFMIIGHGWGKLTNYSARLQTFSDPIGIGSEVSLTLAVFAEFFCSIAVMLGFMTRLVLIPLIITMAVAFFFVHFSDPFTRQEKALLFLVSFIAMWLAGPGRFSLDAWIASRQSARS